MTERELIEGCLRGSALHQRALYDRFSGKMYAVCIRYAKTPSDAADLLQEGFIKVFGKIGQYHYQGSFEGWIRRVMVNTCLRAYQRQRFEMEQSGLESLPDPSVPPDAVSNLSEVDLLGLIAQLPEGYRLVFNLVAIEGYTHAEVAEILGIQEGTSRSQLTKARRWLAEQLLLLEKNDHPGSDRGF